MSFTKFRKNISWKKLQLVLLSSLNNLISPAFTLLLSLLVVRLVSIELWGEYARSILVLTLLSQIAAWGNKEYLSREFSKNPGKIESLWMESFISRSILLIPLFAFLILLPAPVLFKGYLVLILCVRFLFQSFDSILLYRRSYQIRILLELAHGIIFAFIVVLFQKQLTVNSLLLLTLGIDLLKTLLVLFFTRLGKRSYKGSFRPAHLQKSFLFFLLMFTSLLASRIDQVNAALFLEDSEMGKYQILMSFLLMIQASSNFVLQPFIKNIYRLKFNTVQKIALKLFLLGIPLSAIGIFFMNYILVFFYSVKIDPILLPVCYFFTLPIFFYSPYIFHLYKKEQVGFVIVTNIAGSFVSFAFSLVLMNIYGKGIWVMLLPASIVQCLTLIVYMLYPMLKKYPAEEKIVSNI